MLNRKLELISGESGSGQFVRVALILVALLLFSGAVTTVQAQKMPGVFSSGEWFLSISPTDHTAYYLPYYDNRCPIAFYYFNLGPYRFCRGYEQGYWYPWTFRWGRYDVPNSSWWTFGEGFFDEYGTGGIWMTGSSQSTGGLKAIQTMERRVPAVRASRATQRMTHYRGTTSSGISASRGGSMGSSGGGSFGGSTGGGSKGGKK